MTSRIDQIGRNGNDGLAYQDDDLTWFARHLHEWPTDCLLRSHGVVLEDGRVVAIYRQYEDQATSDKTYTKDEWQSRRAELQNKSELEYNPEDVSFTEACKREFNPPTSSLHHTQAVQVARETGMCSDGFKCGIYCDDCPNDPSNLPTAANMVNHPEQPHDMVDPLSDLIVTAKPTTYRPSMSELYPNYYKDVSSLTEVYVYAIHDLFGIDDPSGCIQHASKKLLLCGVRTGGKPAATEIKEARDTLTRKLQLMGEE